MLLLSQNYIDSQWCGDELEHFIRTHANDPNKPTDVFVVELFPFDTFDKVPPNIHNLRKRLIHAQFWHQPADTSAPMLSGNPTPKESGPENERHYWQKLHELRNAIDSRRRDQPSSLVTVPKTDSLSVTAEQSVRPALGTILLADTTDDLAKQRDAVKAALEPEGVVVLPGGDYVGLSPEEFKTEFTRDLVRCDLFVQLLSPIVGRKGKGFATPVPQLQFDGAIEAKRPILQWCERLPGSGDINDPAHARLFNTAHLRVTNRVSFEREILERLRAIKQAAERARTTQDELRQTTSKRLIFLDDVAGEPDLNQRLRAFLQGENRSIRSLPQQAPLGNNGIDIAQVLKPCTQASRCLPTAPNKSPCLIG